MRALPTYYRRTNQAPTNRRLLHLDGDRNGGRVINTAVVSNVAPPLRPARHRADRLHRPLPPTTVLNHRSAGTPPASMVSTLSTGEHVAMYPISAALPAMPAGQALRQPVDLGDGIFVAGDHRDTPSIQGALASGHRAAQAIRSYLTGTRRS